MGKKKYYAIKEGIGTKNKIVNTWAKCKKLVLGYNSVYKSFTNEEDAKNYLSTVNLKKVKEQTVFGIEKKKIIKMTTRLVQARIPNKLYSEFENKCNEYGWEINIALIKLIEEWVE
jgi:viroplasmin and RNaseH domain-containing protein